MVSIQIEYTGALRCAATHGPSGARLESDAPVDNHGRGESFSPTDLVATGLGSCMLTLMGIRAQQGGYSIDGARATVAKHMTASGPRRIERLRVALDVPEGSLTSAQRDELLHAAHTCPVRLSILEAIEVPVALNFY
jgi:putative redox protein